MIDSKKDLKPQYGGTHRTISFTDYEKENEVPEDEAWWYELKEWNGQEAIYEEWGHGKGYDPDPAKAKELDDLYMERIKQKIIDDKRRLDALSE